jgi:hypothetical protein
MSTKDKLINTNPGIIDHRFNQNKNFPNSKLPLLIYKNACLLGKQKKRSAQLLLFSVRTIGKTPGATVSIVFITTTVIPMKCWGLLPAKPG